MARRLKQTHKMAPKSKHAEAYEMQRVLLGVDDLTSAQKRKIRKLRQVEDENHALLVPEVQIAEVVKQEPMTHVREKYEPIPKIEARVVEKVVEVPHQLVQETALEVPQVCVAEVDTQIALIEKDAQGDCETMMRAEDSKSMTDKPLGVYWPWKVCIRLSPYERRLSQSCV